MKRVRNTPAGKRLRVRGAAVLLILCLLIIPVTAEEASALPPGGGTDTDPYLLSTPGHFLWMAGQTAAGNTFQGKYFEVRSPIDFTGIAFTPIGNYHTPFMGTVNGGDYTIANLTMDNSSEFYFGLFGHLDSAAVSNISLANCSINGAVFVGSLAGSVQNSILTNVQADETTVVTGSVYVGGLTGGLNSATLAGGTSHAAVRTMGTGTETGIGGLAGLVRENSIIKQSCADGDVMAPNATAVGGLAGLDTGGNLYVNTYAAGNVTGNVSVGGLIGDSLGPLIIVRSYASGNISGQEYVGGLIGGTEAANIDEIRIIESVAVNPQLTGSSATTHRITGGFGTPERFRTDAVYAREDMLVNGAIVSASAENGISAPFAELTTAFYRDTLHWNIGTSDSTVWHTGELPYLNRYVSVPPVYLTIAQPSENERVLAEGRDFYVWGNFTNPSDIPVNIRISLKNETGNIVRMVKSTVNTSGVTASEDVNMSRITDPYYKWGGILAPDLIENPGGYENAENKLLVNKTLSYYHGMIQGGATKEMGTYNVYEADGTLKEIEGVLTAGTYTVIVEAFDIYDRPVQIYNDSGTDLLFRNQSVDLTFGLTNASLGLFRPDNTKQKLIDYAKANNRRTYFDWFPGYFQMGNAGYEIRDRWQPNNAIEAVNYLEGTVLDKPEIANNTVTLYHIGQNPATYQVELAGILNHSDVDSGLLTFLYYDVGEPDVTWRNATTGEIETRSGTLTPLPDVAGGPADARIHYTHADISAEKNVLSPGDLDLNKLKNESIDLRADDTPYRVEIIQGENVIFYGVTRPIKSTVEPIETARGIPQDQILSFTYTNDTLGTFPFPGKLNRTFLPTPDGKIFTELHTNYEFGHLFNSSVTSELSPGEWVFTVAGYNKTGVPVGQTGAELTLTVCKVYDTNITDTSTGDAKVAVNKVQLYSPEGGLTNLELTITDASRTPVQDGYHVAVLKGLNISITSSVPEGTEVGGWISFNIARDELARYHAQPEEISVLHYTNGTWEKLHTEIIDKTTDPVQFRAKTHSFSDFAIVVPAISDNGGPDDGLELLASVKTPTPASTPSSTGTSPVATKTPGPTQTVSLPATGKPTETTVPKTEASAADPTETQAAFPGIGLILGLAAGYSVLRKR